ncbi:hypothetical protein CKAH01_13288 [Colletotrichum kahawae]|uniref:Uncharacterized protein n=1 Tax=Colletotrichum kahawae TaxID=34407 RepID=A0AAE0DE15_COLKA|nr:hypothetical protein CKAH01_13288 [Colletotrichum kahawae]
MAAEPEEGPSTRPGVTTRAAARQQDYAGSNQTLLAQASDDSSLLPQPMSGSTLSPIRSNTPATSSTSISQGTAISESVRMAIARVPIPLKWVGINASYWGNWAFTPSDTPNSEQVDAALVFLMEIYAKQELEGQPLFYQITDDLSHWPDEWFASANPGIIKDVNRFLHCRGVLPDMAPGKLLHETLAATVATPEFVPWNQQWDDYVEQSLTTSGTPASGSSNCDYKPSLAIKVATSEPKQRWIKEHQYHSAITIVLTGKAEEYYYLAVRTLDKSDFLSIVNVIRSRFETHDRSLELLAELRALSYGSVARGMEGKPRLEILEELINRIDKLAKTQPTEGTNERKVGYLCTAVQQVPEARMTLHAPPADYETLCSRLRASFSIEARMPKQQQFQAIDGPHQ